MRRLTRVLAAVAVVGTVHVTTLDACAQQVPLFTGVHAARLGLGSIQGVVSDERGGPLAGAMVSALGAKNGMAVTDARGRFLIDSLPSGVYIVRVHLAGFASSRRDYVRVGTSPSMVEAFYLRRDTATADTLAEPVGSRTILTAGMELPQPEGTATAADDHPHGETAWRLRHLKRSVLKDSGEVVSIADAAADEEVPPPPSSLFGRAFDGAASMASSLFADLPFSGEVNLLTTSAFMPGQMFSGDFLPRGVAYVSLGAPLAGGEWTARASMTQSDLSSWIVAGSFSSHRASSHSYGFGVSYSTQQYQSTSPMAIGAATDNTRNVGEIYGSDHWTIVPALALDYSTRYAHYDYLRDRSLMSPRVGLTLTPFANTHLTASVAQHMLAPGAEEFLAPASVGPWLPPERTFAPLDGRDFRVERARMLDIGVEHEFDADLVLGVRRFQQSVDDQLVTLFGLPVAGGPKSPGHYYVANAGSLDAEGWAVRFSSAPSQRVRGSVEYSITRAHWVSRGDMAAIAVWAPEAIRPQTEDVHGVTTSLETEIPETATRLFFLYKVNTSLAHSTDPTRSTTDSRFGLQVNQALPFMPFGSTRWEVLVGVRNLFRDPAEAGSIYDELLVVRPPKRVVGGVLVKF
ncbi:MAG: hypothetical protein DMF84_18700 [Acidobacteria bacterium]|nr:MAG: hypothetical protein DMF84_18700 [Acidobacteriota bacterium]